LRSLLLRRRVLVDQLKLLCFNSSEFASRLVCGDTCKIARIFRPVLLCDHRNETILSHALHPGGLPWLSISISNDIISKHILLRKHLLATPRLIWRPSTWGSDTLWATPLRLICLESLRCGINRNFTILLNSRVVSHLICVHARSVDSIQSIVLTT
jgi:hypothetical protein